MKTKFYFAILLVGILFNGCIFDPDDSTEEKVPTLKSAELSNYYVPLSENANWVYATSTTDKSGAVISSKRFTTSVVGKKTVNGNDCWIVDNTDGNNTTQLLYVKNNIVYEVDNNNMLEKQLLNFRITPGNTWEISRYNNTTVIGSFDGYETQRVSYGTFEKTARFTITTVTKVKYMKNGKKHLKESRKDTVLWYAENVGLIKEVNIVSENQDIVKFTVKELSKYNMTG